MLKQAPPVPQTNYSGGLNSAENPLAVKDNESPDCANVHTNVFGSVERRGGKEKLNTSAVGASAVAYGALDFQLSASSRILTHIWDDTLYKMDSLDGTWDAITMTVAIGTGRAELRAYLKKLVIVSHISGNIQSWDGSAGATATISGAAAFKYGWADDITGRFWAAGLANNEGVAYFSPTNTLSFDTTNDKLQVSNTDVIMGYRTLKGRLYAMGQRGWYRIDDLGGDPRYGARFVAGPGTLAPETAQVADILGVGEGIVYLDTNKQLRFFNGLDAIRISYKFDHKASFSSAHSLDRASASRFENTHAVVWPARNWYMLHYSEDSDSANDNVLVYDLNAKSAWPFTEVPCNAACVATDGNGVLKLYQSASTGITWRADSGDDDDDGTGIISHYDFSRKPAEEGSGRRGLMHKWRQVALALKATGAHTITLKVRMDFATGYETLAEISLAGTGVALGTFVLGTDVLGGVEAVEAVIGIDRLGKHCQLRLETSSANPAWQLFSDELSVRPLGVY